MTDNGVLPLKVNRLSLSAQAQRYLVGLIEEGAYQPGERLPSENELAAQLGISRPTLREALLNLEQDGIVIRRHGVGTFVAPGYEHRLESGLEHLESVLESAARQGLSIQCHDLHVRDDPATRKLADKLQIEPGTPLLRVDRVLVTDGTPVAYMDDYTLGTILSSADIDDTFNGSVLDLLRQKPDLQVVQVQADIVALNADASLAKKLKVKPGQAVLLLEELLFDQDGKAIEFSRNYFVPEFFRFHVVRR
ncbi:MAG: GntR family transcriptional regulator [Anaerolineae bacterium]